MSYQTISVPPPTLNEVSECVGHTEYLSVTFIPVKYCLLVLRLNKDISDSSIPSFKILTIPPHCVLLDT